MSDLEKMYTTREWLFPLGDNNNAYITTKVSNLDSMWINVMLTIGNGDNQMSIYFDIDDEDEEYKNGIAALYKLRDEIHMLANAAIERRKAYLERIAAETTDEEANKDE